MTNVKLKSAHVYILMIMSTGFMLHVLILPNILTAAGRDAWVSVLFSIIPIVLIGIILYYISRSLKQKSLLTFLHNHYSPPVVKISAALLGLIMFSEAFVTMKYTLFWAKDNYASEVPNFVIIFTFTGMCCYASFKGVKSIAYLGPLLFLLVCLFGIFIGVTNTPKKDYTLLFPVFEQGIKPSLKGMIYVCAAFGESLYLLLLQGYTKRPFSFKGITLTLVSLLILTLGPLAAAIAEFGPEEASMMNNPAYEEWKLLTIGRYITRVDYISIFQWSAGAMIRISLLVIIANEINGIGKKKWSLLIIYSLLGIGVLINWQSDQFFSFLYNIYYPLVSLLLLTFLVVSLLLVKLKSR
ncbi:GerAB/ArcD/ProY family transporter [Peribacillus sp. SI8-4]|uniref:GerAB/ArcD/ProY family transporter n=1 Tax=Peribacillus sp. SI8-4 TaxID=3048009 RepID=UPI0025575F4B|nr:GerAB/ArcD/ProY family transporter [Peribacillus sp. SI8-4]